MGINEWGSMNFMVFNDFHGINEWNQWNMESMNGFNEWFQ